jgi:hypothetical protein
LRFGEDIDWYMRARDQSIRIKRLDQVTLFVRRHGQNMTQAATRAELSPLRMVKKALDRRRQEAAAKTANAGSKFNAPE